MRKFLICLSLVVFFALSVSAKTDVKFKDVPDDMWAASSVYDLVKMGITKGYPDGTFRGNKTITRYETAVFLSKLAKSLGADLKGDLADLKEQIAALKKGSGQELAVSGQYETMMSLGNVLAAAGNTRGGLANYRLKLNAAQNYGDTSKLAFNLDTMNYGYGATSDPNLATQLLDITSIIGLDLVPLGWDKPVNLTLTYGPGPVQNNFSYGGVFPSLSGEVYTRPKTAILAGTQLWGADVSGGYVVETRNANDLLSITRLTGTLGYKFLAVPLLNTLQLETTADYVSSGYFSSSQRDIRAQVSLAAPLTEKVSAAGTVGLAGSGNSKMMVAGEVALNDMLDTGTVATVRFSKIGESYIDQRFQAAEFTFAGLDAFNRPLENSTVNLGGKVIQTVSNDIKLVGKGELRLDGDYKYSSPKGRLTAEGGISYAVAANTSLDALYRVYQDRLANDTTDLAAVGLQYKF